MLHTNPQNWLSIFQQTCPSCGFVIVKLKSLRLCSLAVTQFPVVKLVYERRNRVFLGIEEEDFMGSDNGFKKSNWRKINPHCSVVRWIKQIIILEILWLDQQKISLPTSCSIIVKDNLLISLQTHDHKASAHQILHIRLYQLLNRHYIVETFLPSHKLNHKEWGKAKWVLEDKQYNLFSLQSEDSQHLNRKIKQNEGVNSIFYLLTQSKFKAYVWNILIMAGVAACRRMEHCCVTRFLPSSPSTGASACRRGEHCCFAGFSPRFLLTGAAACWKTCRRISP